MTKDFPRLFLRGKRKYVNTPEIISAILQYFSISEKKQSQYEIVFRKAITSPVFISNNNYNSEALVIIRRTVDPIMQEYYLLPANGVLELGEEDSSVQKFSLFERGFALHSASESLPEFLGDYFYVGKKWYLKYKQVDAPIVRKIRFTHPVRETEQTFTYVESLRKGCDRWLVYSDEMRNPIIEIQISAAPLKTL